MDIFVQNYLDGLIINVKSNSSFEEEKNEEVKRYLEETSKSEQAIKLILDNAKYTK